MQQRRVIFSGNVQGVGFRYTTVRTAEGFDVTGYVRNQPDGTVECVAEGDRKEIDAFLDALRDRMGRHIRNEKSSPREAEGSFSGFRVRY